MSAETWDGYDDTNRPVQNILNSGAVTVIDDYMAELQKFVKARFPDAYAWKYAALSMVIWCPLLDCRLSGYFHTEKEAWEDAVKWIKRKKSK